MDEYRPRRINQRALAPPRERRATVTGCRPKKTAPFPGAVNECSAGATRAVPAVDYRPVSLYRYLKYSISVVSVFWNLGRTRRYDSIARQNSKKSASCWYALL